jgi:hypothetical protein
MFFDEPKKVLPFILYFSINAIFMEPFLTIADKISRPFFLFPFFLRRFCNKMIRMMQMTVLAGQMCFKIMQILFFELVILILPR